MRQVRFKNEQIREWKSHMALVKCKECGKQISDKAESCPSCGVKLAKMGFFKKIFIGILVLVVIFFIGVVGESKSPLLRQPDLSFVSFIEVQAKKGFDKSRINREVKEEANTPKGAGDPLNPIHKALVDFNTLINGSHAQSEATIKVLERIAAERTKETGKTVTANQVAVEATNKPGGLAEIVKQIKKELPPAEQNTTPPVLPPGTIDPTLSSPTAEKIGAGVEALGSMFRVRK